MSPEQAGGDLDALGPRSDVYSLGATLYCVLTGKPPYEGDAADVLRAVASGEFRRPLAVDPAIDPALEAVCLKAMATAPEDRYASCRELAEDVDRWTADEPVFAWREPLTRRAQRWAKRNRTAVTAAGVALVAAIVGLSALAAEQGRSNVALKKANNATSTALIEARKARDAAHEALAQSEESRKQAEAVSDFLAQALVKPDPYFDGKDVKVADVLDQAAAGLEKGFAGSKATEAALLSALARGYQGLGLYPKAEAAYRKAWTLKETVLGPAHRETLQTAASVAVMMEAAGRPAEAATLLEDTLRRKRETMGNDDESVLGTRFHLAATYSETGRLREALEIMQEVVATREARLGHDAFETLRSRGLLANIYSYLGRTAEAVPMYEANLKALQANLGSDHPETINGRWNLAAGYNSVGRSAEAIALFEANLGMMEAKLGPDHPATIGGRGMLGDAYRTSGSVWRSIPLLEGTVRLSRAKRGPADPRTIGTAFSLALAYETVGRWADAEPLWREILARDAREKPGSPSTAGDLALLGRNLVKQGKGSEAEPLLRECLAIRTKLSPDDWLRFNTMGLLGGALAAQGKYAEAEPLVVGGYEGLEARAAKIPAAGRFNLAEGAERVVRLYEAWGRPDRAKSWAQKLRLADLPEDVFARP
jgi:eukaryotic-like serine/threonine-protein kinase